MVVLVYQSLVLLIAMLSVSQLQNALQYLTPLEKQEALLARFVLTPIPNEILSDEVLDLLWDAKNRVGAEVFSNWRKSVSEYLKMKPMREFSKRQWQWIEESWLHEAESLDIFSPPVKAACSSMHVHGCMLGLQPLLRSTTTAA